MLHTSVFNARRASSIGRRCAGLTLIASIALAGCASVPPPDGAMNMAQNRLQAARDADAADYAPVDLGFAQNKFQQAQSAMATSDYAIASNLADESSADAELARAKARLGSARAKIKTKTQDNARLRQRMEQAHPELSNVQPNAAPPAGSAPSMGNMPAPSASALSSPVGDGAGFQTIPQGGSGNDASGYPATDPSTDSSEGNQP